MTVKIEQRKLLDLLEAYFKLAALESGGVDNWEWYSESLYSDEDSFYEEIQDMSDDDLIDFCGYKTIEIP